MVEPSAAFQPSLRDGGGHPGRKPWVETQGYNHSLAARDGAECPHSAAAVAMCELRPHCHFRSPPLPAYLSMLPVADGWPMSFNILNSGRFAGWPLLSPCRSK